MQIYGPSHVHGPQSVSAPHALRNTAPAAPSVSSSPSDELQLSDVGRLVDAVRDLPDIRADRVAAIKAQIANGTYANDHKLDVAVSRLLDEIA
ncbi:MAG: flagellar biosynthesis anti-sigma factor FlgM [Pirellulales bacterium]|nr:flagellar biosynthesis anti-sigma factor FlgM [Pirellulales bacterium]